MGPRSILGNSNLAATIRKRRVELGLTIEEAAQKADVGTKTWSRYEAGESIRQDKYKGVCKALNWLKLPDEDAKIDHSISVNDYKTHELWSKYLADTYGESAAASFAIGSDILIDNINEDIRELSKKPKGTHLGQIETSYTADMLPAQFLMNYDYEFVYLMRTELLNLRENAKSGTEMIAHSVLQELVLYLVVQSSRIMMECTDTDFVDGWDDWIFEMFDDMDIISFLYTDYFTPPDHIYHFKHWSERQFCCD